MKKLICSALTVVLVISLFVPASFAAKEDYPWVVEEVERTNEDIDGLIEEAIDEVEELDENDKHYEKDLNKLIWKLEKETNKLADKMVKKAAKVGIEVICEYVEYQIGGQSVLIDPLIIIGF